MTSPTLNIAERLVSPDRQAGNMVARLRAYLSGRSGVSLAELSRDVPGFAGDLVWGNADANIVIWPAMSRFAIDAMCQLISDGSVTPVASHELVYYFDGSAPNFPVADHLDLVYRDPHWFPVVFQGENS